MLREHGGPLLFALTALTSLLLLNYIAKQIDELVGKGLSAGVIGQFFALSLPFTIAMTTPMSVLVATLYAFSRLASENEITAMKANGISLSRLLVPVLVSASFISVGMIAFNDIVLPASNHQLRKLQTDIARKKPTFALKEQIINQVADRQVYLKAMRLGADNKMTDVTIYDLTDVMRRRTIYADSGELAFAANGKDLLLTLYEGSTITIPRAEPEQLERAKFARNYVRVEGVANQLELTSSDPYKSDREMSVCELQNDVARYEAELARSRGDLRETFRQVAVEALTGTPAKAPEISSLTMVNVNPGAPAPRSPNGSLGRFYCDMKARFQRARAGTSLAMLPVLHAAELQGTPAPTPIPTPVPSPPLIPIEQDSARVARDQASLDSIARASAQAALDRVGQQAGGIGRYSPLAVSNAIENSRIRLRDGKRLMNQPAVELHKKFAISVACTVFVLVGAPVALRFPRGGVGLVIGVSLVIFGIYYVGLIAGETLSDKDIVPPWVSMWAANFLLTIVGLFLLVRMGRESATSRGGDFGEMLEIFRNVFRRDRRAQAASSTPENR